ncbi:MAG: hypothetical protein ACK55I_44545, partial [bacterium]
QHSDGVHRGDEARQHSAGGTEHLPAIDADDAAVGRRADPGDDPDEVGTPADPRPRHHDRPILEGIGQLPEQRRFPRSVPADDRVPAAATDDEVGDLADVARTARLVEGGEAGRGDVAGGERVAGQPRRVVLEPGGD